MGDNRSERRERSMNAITIEAEKPQQATFAAGDLFRNKENDDVYVLCQFRAKWMAVSLAWGTRWRDAGSSSKNATDGLVFLGRDLKIEVKR